MTKSRLHRNYTIQEVKNLIIPPIALGQSILFRKENAPHAYVSWAYLSESVATGFADDSYRLTPNDWMSGKELWVMDFIAPFGNVFGISRILQDKFAGQTAKSVRFDADRKLTGRPIWKGRRQENRA